MRLYLKVSHYNASVIYLFIYLFHYHFHHMVRKTQQSGAPITCVGVSLPSPGRDWPQHWGLRPLFFLDSGVDTFTSNKNQISESIVREDMVFCPYPRLHKREPFWAHHIVANHEMKASTSLKIMQRKEGRHSVSTIQERKGRAFLPLFFSACFFSDTPLYIP